MQTSPEGVFEQLGCVDAIFAREGASVLIASENAAYNLGGAERSLETFVRHCRERTDCRASVVVVCRRQQADSQARILYPTDMKVVEIRDANVALLKRFHFVATQVLFLTHVKAFLRLLGQSQLVLTQNRWYPYIQLLSRCANLQTKVVIFVRDEKCIGHPPRYQKGWKGFAWSVRALVELPFRYLHYALAKYAQRCAEVVVFNSHHMQRKALANGFRPRRSVVIHPMVESFEIAKYRMGSSWNKPFFIKGLPPGRPVVAMVGTEEVKGFDIFLQASLALSDQFVFVATDRRSEQVRTEGNVHIVPWMLDPGYLYAASSVVCVLSQWDEAFGRVVAEAKQFDVHLIIWERPGLIEAAGNYEKLSIVNEASQVVELLLHLGAQ